jgi:hypothetical protein
VSADGQSAAAGRPSDPPPVAPPPPALQALEPAQQRPEVQVGVAFAGGLLAAMVLRRLGGRR